MRKERLILMISLIHTFVLSMMLICPVAAQIPPTVYFEEPSFTFDISIGYSYNVTIWVKNCSSLMMFQIYITFDDDILNIVQFTGPVTGRTDAVRAWPNDDLGGRAWDPEYALYNKPGGMIGNPTYYHLGAGQGAVKIGDTLLGVATLDPTKTYKLACIEFNVTGTPTQSCALGINNTNTYLYDFDGPIPDVIKIDAEVTIIPEFPPSLMLLAFISMSLIAIAFARKTLRKIQS